MSRKHDKKVAKALIIPHESKTPKASVFPTADKERPEFKADQMDRGGPWGWDKFESLELQEVLKKIFESQKLTWQTLRENGSHSVDVKDLITDAQKRLLELEKDDLDQLYSLRLTGRKRIWAIRGVVA